LQNIIISDGNCANGLQPAGDELERFATQPKLQDLRGWRGFASHVNGNLQCFLNRSISLSERLDLLLEWLGQVHIFALIQ
jgi:hypothetical protein